jgi:hypothetical protein
MCGLAAPGQLRTRQPPKKRLFEAPESARKPQPAAPAATALEALPTAPPITFRVNATEATLALAASPVRLLTTITTVGPAAARPDREAARHAKGFLLLRKAGFGDLLSVRPRAI